MENWIRYEDLSKNNQTYFNQITSKLGIENITVNKPKPANVLSDSFLSNNRFNQGVNGRGRETMTTRQIRLISKMIDLYEIPIEYKDYLLTGTI